MSLPPGWAWASLGEITDVQLGKMLDAKKNKGDPIRYLRNVNVRWGKFDLSNLLEMRVTPAEFDKLAVRDGDIFVCEGGEPGRSAVWREGSQPIVFQKALHRIRALDAVDPEYIVQYLRLANDKDIYVHLLTGTTIKHLPQVALKKFRLPIAPIAEQRRIVTNLSIVFDKHTSQARLALSQALFLSRKVRTQAIAACFDVSDAESTALGRLLQDIEAGKNMRCEERPPRVGERGVVKVSAVTWGRFDPTESKTLPVDYEPPGKALIRAGDLLISRANTLALVGATALVEANPDGLYLSDKILRLVLDESLKKWVMWFLRSPDGRRQIETMATGNQLSMRNISQDALRRIELPMPDAETRRQRIERLEATLARADRLEAEANRALALLDRLESAILDKAFRGELVPQDPNDEPASVMLERIRAEPATEKPARRRKATAAPAG